MAHSSLIFQAFNIPPSKPGSSSRALPLCLHFCSCFDIFFFIMSFSRSRTTPTFSSCYSSFTLHRAMKPAPDSNYITQKFGVFDRYFHLCEDQRPDLQILDVEVSLLPLMTPPSLTASYTIWLLDHWLKIPCL